MCISLEYIAFVLIGGFLLSCVIAGIFALCTDN